MRGSQALATVFEFWDSVSAAIPQVLAILVAEEESGTPRRRLQSNCYRALARLLGVGALAANAGLGNELREALAPHCEKLMPRCLAILARTTNATELDRQALVARLQDSAAECVTLCQSIFPGAKGRRWCLRLLAWSRGQLRALRERVDGLVRAQTRVREYAHACARTPLRRVQLEGASPLTLVSLRDEAEGLVKEASEKGEEAAAELSAATRKDRLAIVFALLHGMRLLQVSMAAGSEVTSQVQAAMEAATAEDAAEATIKAATEARDELADASAEWMREGLPHAMRMCKHMESPKLMCMQALNVSIPPLTFNTAANLLRLTRTAAGACGRPCV